jgi:hypothetical protein
MNSDDKYKNLLEQYNDLVKEHESAKRKITFLQKISTSFGLAKRISEYQEKVSLKKLSPQPETQNLLAALTNRALVGSALSVLLSIGTIILIGSQTYVFFKQKDILQGQQIQASLLYYVQAVKDDEGKLNQIQCSSEHSEENYDLMTLVETKGPNRDMFEAALALGIDPSWRGGKHINDFPDTTYSVEVERNGKVYTRRLHGNEYQVRYAVNLEWIGEVYEENQCTLPLKTAIRVYSDYYWNKVMVSKLSYVLGGTSDDSVYKSHKGYPEYQDTEI